MKKLLAVSLLTLMIISGCINPDEKFTGYLVAKEYTPAHQCCSSEQPIRYAGAVYVPVTTPKHYHRQVAEKWTWFKG